MRCRRLSVDALIVGIAGLILALISKMVRSQIIVQVEEATSFQALKDLYRGVDKRAATFARGAIRDIECGNEDKFLLNLQRQLPLRHTIADLWLATLVEREEARGRHPLDCVTPQIRALRRYAFAPYEAASADLKGEGCEDVRYPPELHGRGLHEDVPDP